MSLALHFAKGNVSGNGRDQVGTFNINGIYSPETSRVIFTKTFDTHSVEYSGTWDDRMIYGKWMMDYGSMVDEGEFEIWPETGEEVEEEVREAIGLQVSGKSLEVNAQAEALDSNEQS